MTEVSSTRLYLGNLPRNATKADVEAHFASHGTGEITEIKLMNGFGFIEYKDAMDARDVVPAFHGSTFMGERLTVQFARGSRHRENGGFPTHERSAPRPRRTPHRMQISGLPTDTSWQDLKDFARQSGCDVVYSETGRNANGEGFVEFETAADLKKAVEALDGREFKDLRVTPNPTYHQETAVGGLAHQALGVLTLRAMTGTDVVHHPLAGVHAETDTVMATVTGARVATTTMIVRGTDRLLAAVPWTTIRHLGVATMILTDVTTHLPTRT
ncbi:Pre-mRNA-splicing factor srp2 [Cytospora mali]|uniref:Pre-mRNA-splicing factor srp2 n=1 Tax=Cytospora mali TaxID=578113 RepID=A0A194UMV9_CYTMA|nr:Pre-mRNA-splicing factor srp2 [Valsa mali var. pyri (nom. inval.)]